jgi:hypothetical protein
LSGVILLLIEVDGREQLLYEYLTAQLAAQLEVECEPSASIDQVVAAFLNASRSNSYEDVNLTAFEILTQIRDDKGQLPVPEPLRKLGAIQPLRLFLSTTVDSLLANAFGSPADHVFAYSPISTLIDIPRDYARSPHRVVFHLFPCCRQAPRGFRQLRQPGPRGCRTAAGQPQWRGLGCLV